MLHTGQSSVLTGPCQSSHSPQAHGDLVSAVDFSEDRLVTGYEDSNVGVWSMETGRQLHDMPGHNGGVTGIQLQVNIAATSSYDSTVGGTQIPSRRVSHVWCRCGCGTWSGGSVSWSSPTQTHSAAASHLLATESWPGTLTASFTSGRSPSPRTTSRYPMLFSLDRYM